MQVTENEQIYAFDVDKTLISARRSEPNYEVDERFVFNPYTGELVYVTPHKGHVDLLKEMHGRGRHIVVWSAAGVKWAQAIIENLELELFVHEVKTKPLGYIDDEPVSKWLTNHIYLQPEDRT